MSGPFFSLLPHRSAIAVSGVDRIEFLQGLLSNDTTKVAPGRAIWAALLTPQGRFLNDMFVVDDGSDNLLLETERERAAALAKKLSLYKLRSRVTVEDRSAAVEVAVAYSGDVARALHVDGAVSELNGIDWGKGCYMGQELTARTKYRGLVKRRLFPVSVEGAPPPPGTVIQSGEQEVGELRSGIDGKAIAMLQLDAARSGDRLTAAGVRIVPIIPDWMRLPASNSWRKHRICI
jgi:folate-binding protein YgfZ